MFKRFVCGLLTVCLLLGCTSCGKADLEDIKAAMVSQLNLSPIAVDAAKTEQWYGVTADNCDQAVVFMLTEDLYPGEIVMVKAKDDKSAQLIAAATSRRLSSLKSQTDDRAPAALSCTIQQDGKYVAMFFSQQHDALQAIYDKYMK